MGMEVAGSDMAKVNGEAKENGTVNVSEPIKFGSHGADEQQAKPEAKNVSSANVPKDAVDEWPDAPQVHSFWVVKYRSFEDPNLKAKMEQVDKEILKTNQRISQIIDQLKPKRAAKSELMDELRSLGAESSQYSAVINEKRQEMKPLQDALGTLRGRGVGICSTEEELNELIRSLEYRIQHESMSLKEEKQLMREMKELEATRPKVIANTARRAKIQDALGQTDVIQDQVKSLGTDLDGVRKQRAALKARMDQLGSQVKTLEAQIKPLQEEFEVLDKKRDDAFKTIKEMRKTRDGGNECYYQNRNILNNARQLAAKKDLKGLEDLVNAEVDKFMSQWNSSKAFRNDYEKRILVSLDMRQLSRDGRMRNPDEKPIVTPEAPRPQTEAVPKATHKPQKEDPKPTAKAETVPAQKVQSESKKNNKESKIKDEEEEEVFVVGKPKNVSSENKVDEAKLKEMKREEEKEKQRQALERKKKQQEKAAAKAALRAQKEAEKKQKDREKKLKKKEGTSAPATNEDEPTEKEAEAAEQEKAENVEETVETSAPPLKAKGQKENTLRQRRSVKTRSTLPKAILKKKKSNDYWIWASAGAAAVVVLLLLALGYNYFL